MFDGAKFLQGVRSCGSISEHNYFNLLEQYRGTCCFELLHLYSTEIASSDTSHACECDGENSHAGLGFRPIDLEEAGRSASSLEVNGHVGSIER